MIRAALCISLIACAPAAPRANAQIAPPRPTFDAGLVDLTPAPGAEVPTLDVLAATEMPLMREAKRIADVSHPTDLAAGDSDTCFRAVVASSFPVRAWFTDTSHVPRGEIADVAGLVPPRGPVCARKGETLRLVVHAPNAGTIARAVVWQSP